MTFGRNAFFKETGIPAILGKGETNGMLDDKYSF